MTATVALGDRAGRHATFRGRSAAPQTVRLAMPDLLRQVAAGAEADLVLSRAGTGRLFYATRLQYMPVRRRRRRATRACASNAASSGSSRTAAAARRRRRSRAGDLIRVTLTRHAAEGAPVRRRHRRARRPASRPWTAGSGRRPPTWRATPRRSPRTDRSERAGAAAASTASRSTTIASSLFATRLSEGRHEFSYLVRATTAGTFNVAGTWAEEMYAPEVNGRSAPADDRRSSDATMVVSLTLDRRDGTRAACDRDAAGAGSRPARSSSPLSGCGSARCRPGCSTTRPVRRRSWSIGTASVLYEARSALGLAECAARRRRAAASRWPRDDRRRRRAVPPPLRASIRSRSPARRGATCVTGRVSEGGSTITQQVVKLLLARRQARRPRARLARRRSARPSSRSGSSIG